MPRIHWLGTGLSSIPGLRRLLKKKYDVFVWNRTLEKAQSLLDDLTENIYKFDFDELGQNINSGDIVISMLPASHHLDIAKLCLKKNANFISSSYISEELQELNGDVKKQGLVFLNAHPFNNIDITNERKSTLLLSSFIFVRLNT